MKKLTFLSFLIIYINCSFKESTKNNYYTLSINGKKIPSLIEWEPITKIKPFKFKVKLITNKYLYKNYILPFEKHFNLTKKPILIWQTPYHTINGNSHAYFSNNNQEPDNVIVPAPAHKYIGDIFHELVHIYINWKEEALQLNSKDTSLYKIMDIFELSTSFFYFLEKSINVNSLLCSFLTELLISMKNNHYSQREELICDSYVGITLKNKRKNIKILDQYIMCFKKEILDRPHENNIMSFINDFFYYSTHPSHQKRITHLLTIKTYLEKEKSNEVKTWIKKQEGILFNSWNFFNLFYIPCL